VPGGNPVAGSTRYVFNFAGPALRGATRVDAVTNVASGALLFTNVERQGEDAWRVTLDIRTDGIEQGDFRLFLRGAGGALSETVIKTIRP
jgi:glucans biosynthesis protein